jgi:hypothetical protein
MFCTSWLMVACILILCSKGLVSRTIKLFLLKNINSLVHHDYIRQCQLIISTWIKHFQKVNVRFNNIVIIENQLVWGGETYIKQQ